MTWHADVSPAVSLSPCSSTNYLSLNMRTGIAAVYILALAALACASDVVDLNPSNFKNKVLDSDEVWLVEFFGE